MEGGVGVGGGVGGEEVCGGGRGETRMEEGEEIGGRESDGSDDSVSGKWEGTGEGNGSMEEEK